MSSALDSGAWLLLNPHTTASTGSLSQATQGFHQSTQSNMKEHPSLPNTRGHSPAYGMREFLSLYARK